MSLIALIALTVIASPPPGAAPRLHQPAIPAALAAQIPAAGITFANAPDGAVVIGQLLPTGLRELYRARVYGVAEPVWLDAHTLLDVEHLQKPTRARVVVISDRGGRFAVDGTPQELGIEAFTDPAAAPPEPEYDPELSLTRGHEVWLSWCTLHDGMPFFCRHAVWRRVAPTPSPLQATPPADLVSQPVDLGPPPPAPPDPPELSLAPLAQAPAGMAVTLVGQGPKVHVRCTRAGATTLWPRPDSAYTGVTPDTVAWFRADPPLYRVVGPELDMNDVLLALPNPPPPATRRGGLLFRACEPDPLVGLRWLGPELWLAEYSDLRQGAVSNERTQVFVGDALVAVIDGHDARLAPP